MTTTHTITTTAYDGKTRRLTITVEKDGIFVSDEFGGRGPASDEAIARAAKAGAPGTDAFAKALAEIVSAEPWEVDWHD